MHFIYIINGSSHYVCYYKYYSSEAQVLSCYVLQFRHDVARKEITCINPSLTADPHSISALSFVVNKSPSSRAAHFVIVINRLNRQDLLCLHTPICFVSPFSSYFCSIPWRGHLRNSNRMPTFQTCGASVGIVRGACTDAWLISTVEKACFVSKAAAQIRRVRLNVCIAIKTKNTPIFWLVLLQRTAALNWKRNPLLTDVETPLENLYKVSVF